MEVIQVFLLHSSELRVICVSLAAAIVGYLKVQLTLLSHSSLVFPARVLTERVIYANIPIC